MKKLIELIIFLHVRAYNGLSFEITQRDRFLSMLVFAPFLGAFFCLAFIYSKWEGQ